MGVTSIVPGFDREPAPVPTGPSPRRTQAVLSLGDRLFRRGLLSSGYVVVGLMLMVGLFLLLRAGEAIRVGGWQFLTTQEWDPDAGAGHFGIAAVLVGTVLVAAVAIVFAVPLAVGTALYISEYAPRWLRRPLTSVVDLMAAVPSVVFGIWGFLLFQYQVVGFSRWLSTYLGWIPIFHIEGAEPDDPLAPATVYTSSTFIAGIVVAMMVTPVVCAIMREVFSQAPQGEREGALALGATRWGMIRDVVLPFGKGGVIGATMLGLGRALGETIAVFLILSPMFVIQPRILENGGSSISSLIALRYGESTSFGTSALMAAGLVLFLVTLVVNFGAGLIVARSRSGAASEA